MKIELDSNKVEMTISFELDSDGSLQIGFHHQANPYDDWYQSISLAELERAIKFLKDAETIH